jgi:hypothetical protein
LDDLAMQQRRVTAISCLSCLLVLLAGCASPAFWPEFTNALFDAPGSGVCKITIHNGQLLSYSAAVRPSDVPEKVRRTLDKLGGGGETRYLAREWGPRGTSYRLDKLVRRDNRDERRTWLVDDDGAVVGRSYEIALVDVPKTLRQQAAKSGLGEDAIVWADVVLGTAGDAGHFRILLEDRDGRQKIVECRADGGQVVWYRVIQAEVTSTK